MYFWDKHKTITTYYELLSGEVCDRYGLTQMEYDILMFLHNNPQYNTAAEIVKIRKSTKSHVSTSLKNLESKGLVALRYVDNFGKVTETYPANPNGSPNGITAVTTESGRVTIMMPHPERVFRTVSNSWHPENWGEDGPWMRIFRNARKQLG